MTESRRTVQLAQELYELLAARAADEQTTIRAATDALLREQLAAVAHADAATARTLLSQNGLREPTPPQTPLALSEALVNAASDLAASWSALTGRSVRTSHVIRALLWNALGATSRDPRPSPMHQPEASTGSTRTVALAPGLYHVIADRAASERVTVPHMAETLLVSQLVPPGPRDRDVISHLLAHDGLRESVSPRTTLHLSTTLLDQAADFATRWSDTLGRSVRTGQVISALLWHVLAPAPPETDDARPLPDSASDTFTVSVSDDLNTHLRMAAQRRGYSRDALVTALLGAQLDALQQARQQGQSGALLAAPYARRRTRAITTIRVSRSLDGRLRAEEAAWAREERGTTRTFKKGQIIEALLWRALDELDQDDHQTAVPSVTDRPVVIDAPIYARVQTQALLERQRTGQTISVRQLVNRYLEDRLRQDENGTKV